MKKLSKAFKILSTSAVALISLISILVTVMLGPVMAIAIPAQNEKKFENAVTEKMDRLKSLHKSGQSKVVIIGGSSTAFGFDSEFIEKYLGMPVVNLGTYAILGTKLMLDLAENYIDDGDIVIISPEIEEQTLSLYFSSSATLRAVDGDFSLLLNIPAKHWINLWGASWNFALEKRQYIKNGTTPNPTGVYNADNFNKYGDISYDRPRNAMPWHYDPENNAIKLDEGIVSEDFVEYLNNYYKKITRRGAKAYFYYCPMNVLSVEATETYDNRLNFQDYLKDQLDIPILGDIDEHIMDPKYFCDTNFHLNNTGAKLNTRLLLESIFLVMPEYETEFEDPWIDLPDLDPIVPEYDGEYDPNAEHFTYEQNKNGFYTITGVKDEYKHLPELTIPLGYNGYKVSTIGVGAFEGSAVEKVIIPEKTNLVEMKDGAFKGAGKLSALYIECLEAELLPPPASFNGTSSDFTIYFKAESNFLDGYYWSPLFNAGLKWAIID